jgi:hypothetical protein
VVRIDSDALFADHYSFIILLDDESQTLLHESISLLEQAVRDRNVDIHVPRSHQEPFHTTLATVKGHSFPVVAALSDINAAIPHGTWTTSSKGSGDIVLHRPDLNY